MKKKIKVLLISSEMVPFAKTGGLADVAGALPKALFKLGLDIRIAMPKYKTISDTKYHLRELGEIMVPMGEGREPAVIKSCEIPKTDIPVYFIGNDNYYNRDQLYRTAEGDYADNAQRFVFFSRAVMEMLSFVKWLPDVIHCNDWQSGLIPAYLKTIYKNTQLGKIGTIFTIHNIAYQGMYPKDLLNLTGIPWSEYTTDKMEYYDHINLLKAGIVYSDIVSTVSHTYSLEVQSSNEFGRGMEGILKSRSKDFHGIVNGIDYDEWSPRTDKFLSPNNYDLATIGHKKKVKRLLQKENGLPGYEEVPLFGMISRLDDQKGFDLVAGMIDTLLESNVQVVILGTGDQKYHDLLQGIQAKHPKKIRVNLKFDNVLAHHIYGGSDIFVMPSHFEPCGLGQIISFRYGTVPLVRATGGLADTVEDYNLKTGNGTGFVFTEYTPQTLLATIKRGIDTYQNKKAWARLVINAMAQDFSWDISAKKYKDIYDKAILKAGK